MFYLDVTGSNLKLLLVLVLHPIGPIELQIGEVAAGAFLVAQLEGSQDLLVVGLVFEIEEKVFLVQFSQFCRYLLIKRNGLILLTFEFEELRKVPFLGH